MSTADRRATAAKFSAAAEPAPEPAPTTRTKTIRSSLDLPPPRHHALRAREVELAEQYAQVRGVRQALLSAMVKTYLTDETVARRVDAQLAEDLRRK